MVTELMKPNAAQASGFMPKLLTVDDFDRTSSLTGYDRL